LKRNLYLRLRGEDGLEEGRKGGGWLVERQDQEKRFFLRNYRKNKKKITKTARLDLQRGKKKKKGHPFLKRSNSGPRTSPDPKEGENNRILFHKLYVKHR